MIFSLLRRHTHKIEINKKIKTKEGVKMDEETTNEETISLGGNIELSGFKEFDRGTMVVVKKIVGNNTKKISTMTPNFEKISLHLKKIHGE